MFSSRTSIVSHLTFRSSYIWRFSGGSDGKESACNAGDLGSIPGLGRSPGKRNDQPTSSILFCPECQWTKEPGRL